MKITFLISKYRISEDFLKASTVNEKPLPKLDISASFETWYKIDVNIPITPQQPSSGRQAVDR